MKRAYYKYLVSVVLSILIVVFCLRFIDPRAIISTLNTLDSRFFVLVLISYVAMLAFRTVRYFILFNTIVRPGKLFGMVNIYNCINEFLPFRSGELVYLYMVKRAGVPAEINVSSLIIVRLFDFVTVITLGFFGLTVLQLSGTPIFGANRYVWLFPMLLVVGLCCFALFVRYSDRMISGILQPFRRFGVMRTMIETIERLLGDVVEALRSHLNMRSILAVGCSSLGVWCCTACSYWFLFQSIGISVSVFQALLVTAFPALSVIVPIQGVASVGTFEASMGLGLLASGVPVTMVLNAAVTAHVVVLGLAFATGFFGALIMLYFQYRAKIQ